MKHKISYVFSLLGFLLMNSYPVKAESFINTWTGFVPEGNKAYAIEEKSGKSYLVQYDFPSLNSTGKEITLTEQFNYSVANDYGLVVYDYKDEIQENEISDDLIEVKVVPTLEVKSYNLELNLVASKTIPLASYSYTYPKSNLAEGRRKAKKAKNKILQNNLQAVKLSK